MPRTHISKWILMGIVLSTNVVKASDNAFPRVVLTKKDLPFRRHETPGGHNRTELLRGPHHHTVYVGGHGRLFYVDFQTPDQSKEVPVFQKNCRSNDSAVLNCEYDVTVLHETPDGSNLFICGSNGQSPVCCTMSRETLGTCDEDFSAKGIAPFDLHERAPSLYIGDELYSSANFFAMGNGVGIRRNFGKRGNLWSKNNRTEQWYVSMVVSPRDNQLQDKVYAFMVERSLDRHREADPWVSRVIQVCQADLGGPKAILQKTWSSQLSARLSCGFPDRKLYFSRLLDVAVLEVGYWRDGRVYALFTDGWGKTAVCVYTMGGIDSVFTRSAFEGHTGPVPEPRPGMCVEDSRSLPHPVLAHMTNLPKMEDWVEPVNDSRPLMITHHHYRHIRVDRVRDGDGQPWTVLLLALESSRVHKVLLEQDSRPFVVAELHPLGRRERILSVLLQASTKLYVSSNSELVAVDLRACHGYGQRCEDCVQARDPYCGWDGTRCVAASRSACPLCSSTIQDVNHGSSLVCNGSAGGETVPLTVQMIHPMSRYFLRCPVRSHHATYSWLHGGLRENCLMVADQCLLLLEVTSPEQDGVYTCMASEGGHERAQVRYELRTESCAGRPIAWPRILLLLLLLRLLH